MNPKTTQELLNILNSIDQEKELTAYIDEIDEHPSAGSFYEYFLSLPEVASQKKTELLKKSDMDRGYFYMLLRGDRNPGRDNAITLCLAAGLDLAQVQRALEITNLGILYSKNRRDAILIFCINQGLSVIDTNELLDRFGEKTLSEK